ncbi:MAG: TolB family protein [Bacteroidota bacterium]
MKKVNLLCSIIASSFFLLTMNTSCLEQTDKGIFDNAINIGHPDLKGEADFNPENGEYMLQGAGENIWGHRDEFFFLSKEIEGDFILRTRASFLGKGFNEHRKIGIMAQNNFDDDSPHINAVVHGDGLTSLQFRKTKGGETDEIKSEDVAPKIIQLERRGNTFIMSTATEGEPFTQVSAENIRLNDTVNIGIFICSHEADVIEKALFDNVRLIIPAEDDFVPYQDYIGSHIEILDIESGKRKIVHSSPLSMQAPNWSPDGKSLMYNSEGKIFDFNIATSEINEINTGFAQNNNNDHVLSFDGKMLGISDHTEHENNQSLVYVLPATGGEPELITPDAPSYLHGFSQNGKKIVYTAGRGDFEHLDIYKADIETKEETRITDAPGLDDGSEYSPDGKYIYFNSSRSGTMQIWRMKSDGSDQEQLTFDRYNDWFPHVSPDGKKLVFISYSEEVDAEDHPFYKHVYIRTMPADGGKPEICAYVYGGQGSMNVFNRSPDSKKIAFVSNSKQ